MTNGLTHTLESINNPEQLLSNRSTFITKSYIHRKSLSIFVEYQAPGCTVNQMIEVTIHFNLLTFALCPASCITNNLELGNALCKSQAVFGGQTTS